MTTITLPTSPAPTSGSPFLRDFGGILTPFLGGPEQRINRVGTRFGMRYTMPPMESANKGRIFVARLLRGRQDKVLYKWPLNSFNPGTTGSPLVRTGTASGSTLPVKGFPAGYQFKEGQFFSAVHVGQRYIYMVATDATADGSGNADLAIFPMLRVGLSTNDVLEFAQPMIEGFVSPGDELNWAISEEKNIGISFSISESA